MIATIGYIYLVAKADVEFNPYWLAAAAICDAFLINSIADLMGENTPMIQFTSK